MQYVFAPSLLGPKQAATLGLHACWGNTPDAAAHDGTEAGREAAPPPPPPLMVMIAAMLRQPQLDAVREENFAITGQPVATEPPPLVPPVWTTTPDLKSVPEYATSSNFAARMSQLSEAVQLDALSELSMHSALSQKILTRAKDAYLSNVCNLHRHRPPSATDAVRCYLASLKRLCEWPGPTKWVLPDAAMPSSPTAEDMAKALHDYFSESEPHEMKGPAVLVTAPEVAAVRSRFEALVAERRRLLPAPLPVGDVRSIMASAPTLAAAAFSILWQVRMGTFTAAAACEALSELGRGDVAAAVFGMAGPLSGGLTLTAVQNWARMVELRAARHQHGYESFDETGRTESTMVTPQVLLPAFDAVGDATVRLAHGDSVPGHTHVLLKGVAASCVSAAERVATAGAAAYGTRSDFESRWAAVTRGLLKDWDWRNCIAAGGTVVRCLMGTGGDGGNSGDGENDPGDVDLFLYGLARGQLRRRVKELEEHVRGVVGAGKYAVLLTSRTMTIVIDGGGMPRLQLALGLWNSVDDVLSTTDVDCCGAGYDGRDVWVTGRAAAAYATRCNAVSPSRHVVRGSIQFEMRLWKYAKRHGFAVVDPQHGAADAVVRDRAAELRESLRGDGKQRRAATTLDGLRWLMAVDAALIVPTKPKSELLVNTSQQFAELVRAVKRKGYMESDNYGQHEEGYVYVYEDDKDICMFDDSDAEEEPVAAETDTAPETVSDESGYIDSCTSLTRATFWICVPFRNVDSATAGQRLARVWRLSSVPRHDVQADEE